MAKIKQYSRLKKIFLSSILIWVNGYYFSPFHSSSLNYFIRFWWKQSFSINLFHAKTSFTSSIFLLILIYLKWTLKAQKHDLKWNMVRWHVKKSRNVSLSIIIIWVNWFLCLSSIISLGFDENNLIYVFNFLKDFPWNGLQKVQ